MKKPILTLLVILTSIFKGFGQVPCTVDGPSIVCNQERVTILYSLEGVNFDEIRIDAFTVVNGTQILALQENVTNESADIIFLAGGDAEIVVRYYNDDQIVSFCNLNVFVFDETPIPALNQFSEVTGDQVVCSNLDLEINTFIVCAECPFYWTLDGTEIELDPQISVQGSLQSIVADLQLSELGNYELCLNILKPDSTCYVEDCINIDIVQLTTQPSF